MRAALLRNPRSTRNARGMPLPLPEGMRVEMPEDLAALDAVLADLARAGLDLLVLDGGDGTVREVVSRLPELFSQPPILAIVASGNTNLIARKLGAVSDLAGLMSCDVETLARRARPHRVMRMKIPGRAGELRGFIAGWGAYAEGTRIAREEIAIRGAGQVLRAVAATTRRALIGTDARMLRRGVGHGFATDAGFTRKGPCFLGMVTSFEGALIGGLSPFWGDGAGALRWSFVEAPPKRLWLEALPVAFGRPLPGAVARGWHSGRAVQVTLDDPAAVVVDGEAFPCPAGSNLCVSAGETLVFLTDRDHLHSTKQPDLA